MTASSQAGATSPTTDQEIHSDLVETLFGTPGAFVAGVFGGLVAPLLGWMSTGDRIYLFFTAFISCLGLYRICVLIAHARTPLVQRRRDAKKWERLYALGGIGFMSAVGCAVALIFFEHKNGLLSSYSIVTMMSGIGGLAGRNAGRPRIVLGQVVGLAAPLALRGAVAGRSPLLGSCGDFDASDRRDELDVEISKREPRIRVAQRTRRLAATPEICFSAQQHGAWSLHGRRQHEYLCRQPQND